MTTTKRNSFNVSLQRKHNKVVLEPLIERSEREGGVISDLIVDYVEKALDYEKVMGLNKVMQTYKLIQNMVSSQYNPDSTEYQQAIEGVLKRVIRIDGAELSNFLTDPTGYVGGENSLPLSSIPPIARQVMPVVEEPVQKESTPKIEKVMSEPVVENVPVEIDDDEDIEAERIRQERIEARRKKREEQEALLRKRPEPKDDDIEDDEDESDIDVSDLNIGALFND